MTQEQKELLIKDLCARLNTNLVCSIYRIDDYGVGYRDEILSGYCKGDIWYEFYFGDDCGIGIDNVSKIKPYLIPLSKMTEEQKYDFYCRFIENDCDFDDFKEFYFENNEWHKMLTSIDDIEEIIDWFNKNHFDYRCLIPMGLAIDATDKNIYNH
jgi:hypothetical protein